MSSEQKPQPEFRTESIDDVAEILRRAAQFTDHLHKRTAVPDELEEAAEFVEEHYVE